MMSRRMLLAAVASLALAAPGFAAAQGGHEGHAGHVATPAHVAAAVADPARPEADVKRDALRKPAETVMFAGVRPGDRIAEILPGGGYFTRILSKAVGPAGKVYAIITPPTDPAKPPPILAVAADPAYANVVVAASGLQEVKAPEKVDLVWTSQNYHDLHLKRFALDVAKANRSVFEVLKPGGVYLVLDHVGATGSGLEAPDAVHRIDPAIVRQEVEAAGFTFEGESKILANPEDDHTKGVFDPTLRGHTDQFIYKFRKPG